MGFNLGGAGSGAASGAAVGTAASPGIGTLIGALIGGGIGGLQKKKDQSVEDPESTENSSSSFGMDTIMKAIQGFTGGENSPSEDAPKLTPGSGDGSSPYMPPALMGFPSLSSPQISQALAAAMQARRGF